LFAALSAKQSYRVQQQLAQRHGARWRQHGQQVEQGRARRASPLRHVCRRICQRLLLKKLLEPQVGGRRHCLAAAAAAATATAAAAAAAALDTLCLRPLRHAPRKRPSRKAWVPGYSHTRNVAGAAGCPPAVPLGGDGAGHAWHHACVACWRKQCGWIESAQWRQSELRVQGGGRAGRRRAALRTTCSALRWRARRRWCRARRCGGGGSGAGGPVSCERAGNSSRITR